MPIEPIQIIVFPLLTLLAATAVTVARMRNLWAAAMMTGMYSFLGASWMLILDAPDVAFTEAAVGAGISTVLLLSTLALTERHARETKFRPLPLVVVAITGAALVYGTLDMPHYGDPNAPIHRYPKPSYVERSQAEIHIPNIITAVLASYRGYDTLGETTVIFTAGVAVLLLLRGSVESHDDLANGTGESNEPPHDWDDDNLDTVSHQPQSETISNPPPIQDLPSPPNVEAPPPTDQQATPIKPQMEIPDEGRKKAENGKQDGLNKGDSAS